MNQKSEMTDSVHKTVLLHSSIDGLGIEKGDVFVDATLNGGGHSEEVARRFGQDVRIIGIDADADALKRAAPRLEKAGAKFALEQGNFRNMDELLLRHQLAKADKILFDLGWSSDQFERSGRGFSFQKDEPLVMTFQKEKGAGDFTARDVLNDFSEEAIADVLYGYAEETFARKIARAVVEARERQPIETTAELVEIVRLATPKGYHKKRIHYATKTFQALRIAVNDELRALSEGLEKAFALLSPKGRMAVISFHSTEDRIVKQYFRKIAAEGLGTILTKKPTVATMDELRQNPRSRTAKLRIIEKI